MYQFELPIGDWSNDGHGKCEYFLIRSNIPAIDLVPIYIQMDEEFKISSVCKEYEEYNMDPEYYTYLNIDLQIDVRKYFTTDPDDDLDMDELAIESKNLAQLILDLLMLWDDSLKLEIVEEKEVPLFCNWLAPKEDYFDLPGYGLFD